MPRVKMTRKTRLVLFLLEFYLVALFALIIVRFLMGHH